MRMMMKLATNWGRGDLVIEWNQHEWTADCAVNWFNQALTKFQLVHSLSTAFQGQVQLQMDGEKKTI